MKKYLIAIVLMGFGMSSHAGTILQATSASTNMGQNSTFWDAANAIDQSGLSAGYTSGVTDFDSYVATTTHEVGSNNTWFSAPGISTGNFDLNLGAQYDVQSLALWNENQGALQGVNQFNLLADINSDFSTSTLVGSFSATEGIMSAEIFEFSSVFAQFFRLEILSNHGASCCVGIMEVAFESGISTPNAVPIPAAAFLFAPALLGFLGFRRKAKNTAI